MKASSREKRSKYLTCGLELKASVEDMKVQQLWSLKALFNCLVHKWAGLGEKEPRPLTNGELRCHNPGVRKAVLGGLFIQERLSF